MSCVSAVEGGRVQRAGTEIQIEYLRSSESVTAALLQPVYIQSVPVTAQTLVSHGTLGRTRTQKLREHISNSTNSSKPRHGVIQ